MTIVLEKIQQTVTSNEVTNLTKWAFESTLDLTMMAKKNS